MIPLNTRKVHFLLLVISVFVFGASVSFPASAQKGATTFTLDETYLTEDESFSFDYPSDMSVVISDTGTIDLDLGQHAITLMLEPVYSAAFNIDTSSLDDAMDSFIDEVDFLDFDRPDDITTDGGTDAIRADFTTDNQDNVELSFALAVEVDGVIVFVLAASNDGDELTDLTYAIVDTFAAFEVETDTKGSTTADLDLPTLRDHDGGMSGRFWEDSIDELVDLELISDDGELLLTGEMFNTSDNPPLDTPRSTESTLPNAAMGALMSFRPEEGDDDALCGFVARVIANNDDWYDELLFVGVDVDNNLVVLEVTEDNPNGLIQTEDSGEDWYSPNHLSFVLRDNRVIVFVNGEPMWDTEVELTEPNRRGEVEESRMGTNLEFSCVMTGAWGYAFE